MRTVFYLDFQTPRALWFGEFFLYQFPIELYILYAPQPFRTPHTTFSVEVSLAGGDWKG